MLLIFACCKFSVFEGNENMEDEALRGKRVKEETNTNNFKIAETPEQDKSKQNKSKEDKSKKTKGAFGEQTYFYEKIVTIPKKLIPKGTEHLYVPKSQALIPQCPKCPDVKRCDVENECPPCPKMKPCPDDQFECQLKPKWSEPNISTHFPRPMLNSFEKFNK
tara:strand:+ start:2671 stop:3159 length:489 start_codon:yes stop_codon:yes gene_type:complete